MLLDETNLGIIRQLRDGRRSFGDIARKLSITENTVRSRVRKLMEEGVFSISGLIEPIRIQNHVIAFVGVKLKTMNLVKKGEEISRLRGVSSVAVVTGRYDLIVVLMLNDEFGLLEFYTTEMSKVSEVLSVETFVAYDSFNLKVPYIL